MVLPCIAPGPRVAEPDTYLSPALKKERASAGQLGVAAEAVLARVPCDADRRPFPATKSRFCWARALAATCQFGRGRQPACSRYLPIVLAIGSAIWLKWRQLDAGR